MVDGGMKCVKYLLFVFNLIFFAVGLALIILGSVIQSSLREYFEIIGGQFSAAAVLLIIVGSVIFIIGFFGCCGAVKENYCMVMTFAVLLCLVFILEITAGIIAFVMKAKVEEVVKQDMIKSLDKYKDSEATRKGWDYIQQTMECCGMNSTSDWTQKQLGNTSLNYPMSCCIDFASCDGTNADEAYKAGCFLKLKDFLSENILWVGIIGIALSFVQVVGVLFACCLARTIRMEYEVV